MVAVVAGNGLGLGDTSALLLGSRGTVGDSRVGRGNDRVYLNAATGNLVIQSRDEFLLGRGLDVAAHRAYNSQGTFDYGNNDNWLSGLNKRIYGLTGTVNTAGSTVKRADWDGTETVYTYNTTTARYETKAGDGAHDFLTLSGSTWTWTNGDTRATETYDNANGGRITAQRDPSANQITYTYNASGQLTRVESPVRVGSTNTTESVYLDYTGTLLTQVRTVYKNASNVDVTRTRVRYEYDTSNRLSRVRVDLSPDDNSIATGTTFDTTYTYDGTSSRVASITQGDGSRLDFVHTLVGSTYRVTQITQTTAAGGAMRTTSIAYDTVNRTTTITDPLNYATVFTYDASNRLTRITAPAVGGTTQSVQFGYDADSNVSSVTDAKGNVVTYQYNAQGLITLQRDQAGNTVTRTYNSNNQLDSETVYFTPDPDGSGTGAPGAPAVTRYMYDGSHRLRYVLSSEGRVTEFRYDSYGLRTSSHEYTGDLYTGTTYTESALTSWRNALVDKARVVRTDYTYDYRGALASETRSSRIRADGVASLDSGATEYTTVRYVYDSFGNLLQRLPTAGSSVAEVMTYDGLGRVLTSTDLNSALTVTVYDDINTQTRTTFADGLIRTQVYNKAGELISLLEGQGATTLSTTQYRYDALGRLRYVQDPTGVRTHVLYDAASRKVAEIDADGSLTEFFYDANNLVTRTLRYANKLSSAALAGLVDAGGNPLNVALGAAGSAVTTSSIPRPSTSSSDRSSWRLYDAANRLHKEVDARGAVVEYFYDGASRLVKKTEWANFINTTTFAAAPTSANATPSVNAAADRTTRTFYDNDGKLRGTLDGEGFIVEHRYNAAGQKIQTWRYADAAATADRAAAALATLIANRGTASRASDIVEYFLYDGRGLLRSHFDGEGNVNGYAYDQYGNVRLTTRGRRIDTALLTTPQSVTIQFQARATVAGGVWPTVQVRVDGVVVGTVTIGSATNTTYTVTATSVVPVGNHTVDFVYTNDDGTAGNTTTSRTVWISNGALKVGSYTQSFATTTHTALRDDGSGTAAFDGTTVTEVTPTTEQQLDVNAALRFTLYSWVNTSFATTAAAVESTTYSYNAYGQLLSRTLALTGGATSTETFTYDSRRRQTGQTIASGTADARTANLRYDVQGRVVMELGGRGAEALAALGGSPTQAQIDGVWNAWALKHAYDSAGRRVSTTDANGNKTLYYYNGDGKLTHTIRRATDAAGTVYGEVVEHRYDAFNDLSDTIVYGNRLSAATFNGLTGGLVTSALTSAVSAIANSATDTRTQFVYNTTGTLQARREYTGASTYDATTFAYNAFYQESSRTSPTDGSNTVVLATTLDRRGLATATTLDSSGLNIVSSAVYDAFGRVTQTTDGRGVVRRSTYDRAGRIVQTTDGNGQTESMTYDALGNVLTRVDRRGQTTQYAYEAFGRKLTVTTPENIQTVSTYNAHGQLTRLQVNGVAGNITDTTYDKDGNVKTTVVASGSLNLTTTNNYDNAGRLTSVVDARGTTTTYAYDAANRVLTRTVDPGGLGLVTRYAYDGKGQTVDVTDAAGTVTRTTFDAKGQKTQVAVDPTGLNLRTTFAYDKRGNALTVTEGAGTAEARVTQYTYDKAGRLTQTQIDPTGLNIRTTYAYDKAGNVATKTDARGFVTRYAYDNENRLRFTLDAANALVERAYDAAGNVSQVIGYASFQTAAVITTTSAGGNTTHTINTGSIAKDVARDRVTTFAYDKNGRRVFERDALGGLTQFKYDAAGNLIQETRFANRISTTAAPVVGGFSGVTPTADPNLDRTTRFAYDEANRLKYTLDAHTVSGGPGGLITEHIYDANGNLARIIRWGNVFAAGKTIAGNPTAAQVAALLPALTNLSHADRYGSREEVFTYDRANRRVHALSIFSATPSQKQFTVQETQYDAIGQVKKSTRYALAIEGIDLAAVPTAAAAATKVQAATYPSLDRSTQFDYDRGGRLTRSTDGEGFTRQYTYDAVGNKLSLTNEIGAVWNYEYDRAGRLTVERSPTVSLATLSDSADGTAAPGASVTSGRVVTRMTYDALGNVLTRHEGLNNDLTARPESRRTDYAYDALGRQITVTYEAVGIYDPAADNLSINGWNGSANVPVTRRENSTARSSETRYNAFGEAIVNRDVAGGWSYKTYDQLGRLVYDVDPTRAVSAYTYSAQQFASSTLTRFSKKLSIIDGLSVSETAVSTAAANAGSSESALNRSLTTFENRLGQVTRRTSGPNSVYHYDSSGQSFTSGSEWRYDYNVFGDVTRSRTLVNSISSTFVDTYVYYDMRGKKFREIDALGYATDYAFSAFGDLTRTYEYAKALTAGSWGLTSAGLPSTTLPQTTPDSWYGHDREVQFNYDRKGNKLSETQIAVQMSRNLGDLSAERVVNHVYRSFTYDGAGNVVVESNYTFDLAWALTSGVNGYSPGKSIYYFYDALGRRELEVQGTGATVRSQYDALGNVVATTTHFNATSVIWPQGQPRPTGYSLAPASGNDQVVYQYFDRLGRVARAVDATGASTYYSYNARGDVAKEWRPFTDVDGRLRVAIRVFGYDAAGRQTETKTLTQRRADSAMSYATEGVEYNSFGEVTKKLFDGVDREFNDYDNAGRVWRTNAGDGVWKILHYDLQGNLTRQIVSPTVDLKAQFSGPDIGAAVNDAVNYRVTRNAVDANGRILKQDLPVWTNFAGQSQVSSINRTYDRWNNVLSVSSLRDPTWITTYRYNHRNQVTLELKPTVSYWREGTSTTTPTSASPTTWFYFDGWGRQLAMTDANGWTRTARYDSLGRLITEFRPDGGRVQYGYDHQNRQTSKTDEVGRIYTYSYDKANRRTEDRVTVGGTSYHLRSMSYDQLGNRISEVSGQGDVYANQTRRYLFDARGLLYESRMPGGQATTYEYDSRGNRSVETDALGSRTTTGYDYFGRLVAKTDMGGANYSFLYNRAGELTLQTNSRGQNLSYSYYANGLVRQVNDAWRGSYSQFDYDKAGNRTRDIFVEGGQVYRDAVNTYDSNDRLSSTVHWSASLTQQRYSLSYTYDLKGNRQSMVGTYVRPWYATNDPNFYSAVDKWYSYDSMDRVAVFDGKRVGTSIAPQLDAGSRVYYYNAAGERQREDVYIREGTNTTARTHYFSYDFAGRMTEMRQADSLGSPGSSLLLTRSFNANAGSLTETEYGRWIYDGATGTYLGTGANDVTVTQYNGNGWVTQVARKMQGITGNAAINPVTGNTTWDLTTTAYTHDAAGNVETMSVASLTQQLTALYAPPPPPPPNGGENAYEGYGPQVEIGRVFVRTTDAYQDREWVGDERGYWRDVTRNENTFTNNYAYDYTRFDGYKQRQVNSTSTRYAANATIHEYDANGNLLQVTDTSTYLANKARWIVTDTSGQVVQQIHTKNPVILGALPGDPPGPSLPDTWLLPGEGLMRGQEIRSVHGLYRLAHQEDGNVVIYRTDTGAATWSTGTSGQSTRYLAMQSDGNLVLYGVDGLAKWHASTHNNPGARLAMQEDGNLVIYSASNGFLWNSNTVGLGGPPSSATGNSLRAGEALYMGQTLWSNVGSEGGYGYQLTHDYSGNIVLLGGSGNWSTGTSGTNRYLRMMGDGNLVLVNSFGQTIWQSGTGGNPGAQLVVQTDGNLVILNAANQVIWQTGTAAVAPPPPPPSGGEGGYPPAPAPAPVPTPSPAPVPAPPPPPPGPSYPHTYLFPGEALYKGSTINSVSNIYRIVHQWDGNVVLIRNDTGIPVWWTGTNGQSTSHLLMQGDGNLILFRTDGSVAWASWTHNNPGAYLAMQDAGNLVIYVGSTPIWWTNTVGAGAPPPPAPPPSEPPPPPPPPPGWAELTLPGELVDPSAASMPSETGLLPPLMKAALSPLDPAMEVPPPPPGPSLNGDAAALTLSPTPVLPSAKPATPALTSNYSNFFYVNGTPLGSVEQRVRYDAYNNPVGLTGTANFDTTGIASSLREGRLQDDGSTDRASVNGGGTGASYVVQRYDTLRGIARAAYGDETLWYLIAEANALPGNVTPPAGSVLQLPAVTRASNTASTFAVYNPAQAIGDTSPAQIEPPPPPAQGGKGCGNVGKLIMVVVAVVVTIYTAGIAAELIGVAAAAPGAAITTGSLGVAATTGATAGLTATGFAASIGLEGALALSATVGGAVGSAASQVVGKAIGEVDQFSWKNVGLAALGAGVTSALGGVANGVASGLKDVAGGKYLAAAANGVIRSTVTQGLGSALGLQSFDWKAIAVSAITSPMNAGINDGISAVAGSALKGMGEPFSGGLLGVINGATAQAVRMQVYSDGKIDWASIASDAFGNAIGNSVVDSLSGEAFESLRSELRKTVREKGFAAALAGRYPPEDIAKLQADDRWTALANSLRGVADVDASASVSDQVMALASALSGPDASGRLGVGYTLFSDAESSGDQGISDRPVDHRLPTAIIKAPRGSTGDQDLVWYGARALDGAAELTERTVELLGGKERAEAAAFIVQVAVGGLPRTLAAYAIDFVTGPTRGEVGKALGGLIARHGFDSTGADKERLSDINAVSQALGAFGADLILGTARNVVEGGLNVRATHAVHGRGFARDEIVTRAGLPSGTTVRNSPSREANDRLRGAARDPKTKELGYIDPATRKWTREDPADPLQRDHILSQTQIADLNAQYGGKVTHLEHMLTMEENFQLLPGKMNASKHDKMGLDWPDYPGPNGTRVQIPMESRIELQRRQLTIQNMMETYLKSQGLTKR